jgi:transposase
MNLDYDIEQLYIEGHSPKMIAKILDCDVELVYAWIEGVNVSADESEEPEYYGA